MRRRGTRETRGESLRVRWGLALPLLALALASSWVTFLAQQSAGAVTGLHPMTIRLGNAVRSYGWYLAQSVWPRDLAFWYPHPGASLSLAEVGASAAVLAGVSEAVLAWARRVAVRAWRLGEQSDATVQSGSGRGESTGVRPLR